MDEQKALNVYSFSTESYCVDILSKLMQCYKDIEDNRLVEATAFLAQHAGSKFNWEACRSSFPMVSDCCYGMLKAVEGYRSARRLRSGGWLAAHLARPRIATTSLALAIGLHTKDPIAKLIAEPI